MSQLKDGDVHIISDSDDSDLLANGFAGFPSAKKRFPPDVEQVREPPSARKKLKIDGDRPEPVVEIVTDIDSISTNPRRTRTKVSSDTSSKFPVSSPSDTMPLAGHRKKYVKNTLPAGAFERMLQEVAQSHPLMTFQEKLEKWKCCDDLSDVDDVNSFDDQFQKREQQYKKGAWGRRNAGKDSPQAAYNYQYFRMVILEKQKGCPITDTSSPDITKQQNNADQPSCSKELDAVVVSAKSVSAGKSELPTVIHYEKVLCPSSESSATKASPSIRLHWTDEDSVFRCNRLNPEIDKFSQIIKLRIDYKKQINLKQKLNEIFKTPTVPLKYNSECDSPDQRSSLERTNEVKPVEEHANEVPRKVVQRTIETRRSTGGKSGDSKQSSERKSTDKFPPEVSSFQQDEFCNYLGLGMNGKVYSPTPTDNKRRSLRVRRQQQQIKTVKKKNEKKDTKKEKEPIDTEKTDKMKSETKLKDQEVTTTTVTETRNSLSSPMTIKILERTASEEPKPTRQTATEVLNKGPEIRILDQICNSPVPPTMQHTPSTATTANSVPQPTRRIRRTRATSNGTSTCPRSSQSDESPSKNTPRRRRLQHHTRRNNHTSDVSESIVSEPQVHECSPPHNGRASTVPSSEGRKDETPSTSQVEILEKAENLHKKIQRYLEESRKTKPSIFILDSISNNIDSKTEEATVNCESENNNVLQEEEQPPKEKEKKGKQWPKKKIIHRRLLRRNGVMGAVSNQRILRNRTVVRPLRIKISKHPMRKKIRAMKKKAIEMQLAAEFNKGEKEDDKEVEAEKSELDKQNQDEEKSDREEIQAEISSTDQMNEVAPNQAEIAMEVIEEVQCNKSQDDLHSEATFNKSQDDPLSETTCHQVAEKPKTEEVEIQTDTLSPPLPISFLTPPSSRMQNPLTSENGGVAYAYYELDVLTVIQDLVVTFWKTSKLIQVLSKSTCEWIYLGECKRLLFDDEIKAPYKNRICVHNSIPIYVEMRAKELSKERRDCNLISVYINVYYYHDEDLVAKAHSIQLDTVASLPQSVVYTTITDSRYFIMCWSQETMLGRPRSGLCKYSLTPHLDTLASIREFKCMRHEIRYLECTTDDNLIGFGDTQVTLWDHRSGDILMNYDLDFKLGSNFGSIYYPSLEVGQDNTVLIFQKTSPQELSIIAINISHNAPSHRFVCTHTLPTEFEDLKTSMRTDDYVILTNAEHQELWIDCSDPQYMMQIKTPKGQSRFYARCKQNVIDIGDDHLALENFSNFVLKMINATNKDEN